MMSLKLALATLVGLGAIGVGITQIPIPMPPPDFCGNDVQAEIPSPDGRYVATVFNRSCGATTGYNTFVGLRPSGESFDDASSKEGWSSFGVEGKSQVDLTWLSDTVLKIECKECPEDDTFKKEATWQDVQILYQ